jgi:hypothetical protein
LPVAFRYLLEARAAAKNPPAANGRRGRRLHILKILSDHNADGRMVLPPLNE